MKTTVAPPQTGFAVGDIVMLSGKLGLTVMVTAFEVAGFPLAQGAFEVRMQRIISPFEGTYEYAGLFAPALTPLTFH